MTASSSAAPTQGFLQLELFKVQSLCSRICLGASQVVLRFPPGPSITLHLKWVNSHKNTCILFVVVENRNLFFLLCVSAVSISLDRCSALSSGGSEADGSASLVRKGSFWVVSETFLAGNRLRAATPRSSFCRNDRDRKRVYIRDSYELLLNDSGEEFSVSSFNRRFYFFRDKPNTLRTSWSVLKPGMTTCWTWQPPTQLSVNTISTMSLTSLM